MTRPFSPRDAELFEQGLQTRREVLGARHVDAALANATDFNIDLQELITQFCWGAIWNRPGLDRKTRSMINLAMITALNRPHEFKLHVRGALNNGLTPEDIREVLLHASLYCGLPAIVDAFRLATEVLIEEGAIPVPTSTEPGKA